LPQTGKHHGDDLKEIQW